MSLEGQLLDQKSLRAITGKTADWNEIAKDCIAFANATGGRLLLGIEDGQNAPPADQHIPADLPDTVRRKSDRVKTSVKEKSDDELLDHYQLAQGQSLTNLGVLCSEIHQRIGGEIHPKQVKRAMEELIERGAVRFEGSNRWRRYCAVA
ncbi:helix-turn-helix domain-containing protein [Candidatus Symbiobacter mobilis]|uniref:ATP-dependent DNA helicase n=1 Tax=Candidatus Symbiobacter mobilis CR TaxID=946483 RepID=U5NF14_9BURK|nr:RNA-binding domain-containing protein [Candidatus Symbiobacter mobilis]AGX88754.1 ATP-dependent DNA helicase [Candidatus Symbiobacter mobilis CR]